MQSVLHVGSSAVLSQLLALIVSPLLTRLYTQSDFGRFGIFLSYSNIAATIVLIGLADAVLAARDDRDAALLAAAAIWATAILALPVVLLTYLFIKAGFFGLGELGAGAVALVFLELLLLSFSSIAQLAAIRGKLFSAVSIAYLGLGAARSAGQLVLGAVSAGLGGLAVGELSGRCLSMIMMQKRAGWGLMQLPMLEFFNIFRVVREYRHFPMYRLPSAVLSAIGVSAPPMVVGAKFGAEMTGLFVLTFTVLLAPAALVQKVVGDVFAGHFGDLYRSDRTAARKLFLQFSLVTMCLGLIASLAVYFLAPSIFSFVFGMRWITSGRMAAALAVWIGMSIMVGPLSSVILVTNRPGAKLLFDIGTLGALWLSWFMSGDNVEDVFVFLKWLNLLFSLNLLFYYISLSWSCGNFSYIRDMNR